MGVPCAAVFLCATAAGFIHCAVGINNTGTVRLKNVQLQGPENNCSVIPVLDPGHSVFSCDIRQPVTQAQFDVREAEVPATAATELSVIVGSVATPNVSTPLVNPDATTVFSGLQLDVRRGFSVTASLARPDVNKTGDYDQTHV
jgi:hypothetical protein